MGGSGTANYVPLYTAAGSLGDSVMYQTAGNNIGVGNTTAGAKLTVVGGATDPAAYDDSKGLFVTALTGGPNVGIAEFRHDNLSQGVGVGYASIYATGYNVDQPLEVFSRGAAPLVFNVSGGGRVGINTNSPAGRLSISGAGGSAATDGIELHSTGNGSGYSGWAGRMYVDVPTGGWATAPFVFAVPDTGGSEIKTMSLLNGHAWIGTQVQASQRASLNVDGAPVGIDATGTEIGIHGYGTNYGVYGVGESGVYGRATEDNGVLGDGTIGVNGRGTNWGVVGSGQIGGAQFSDTNSSGEALLANGDIGIEAQGTTTGGYFYTPSNSGYGYMGYDGYGTLGYGDTAGGYFSNNLTSAQGAIGQGSYGVVAYGRNAGAGAKIMNIDSNGEASIATTDYGIDAVGNYAGGFFSSFDGTTGGLVGIDSNGGAYVWNSTPGSQAALANGAYGMVGYGRTGGSGGYFTNMDSTDGWVALLGTDSAAGNFTGPVSVTTPGSGNLVSVNVLSNACGPGCGTAVKAVSTGGTAGIFKYDDTDTDNQVELGIFNPGGGEGLRARGYTTAGRFTNSANPTNTVSLGGQGYGLNVSGIYEQNGVMTVRYPAANGSVSVPTMIIDNPSGGAQTVMDFRINGSAMGHIRSDSNGWIAVSGLGGRVYVTGVDNGSNYCYIVPGAGGAWSCASDRKLKKDISILDEGLDKIMQLKPSTYTVISTNEQAVGFIAQEVQEVLPDLVGKSTMDGQETLSVAQDGMIPYMVKAIQELKTENDMLKARLDALEKKVQ